jgi:hypothetical protein
MIEKNHHKRVEVSTLAICRCLCWPNVNNCNFSHFQIEIITLLSVRVIVHFHETGTQSNCILDFNANWLLAPLSPLSTPTQLHMRAQKNVRRPSYDWMNIIYAAKKLWVVTECWPHGHHTFSLIKMRDSSSFSIPHVIHCLRDPAYTD